MNLETVVSFLYSVPSSDQSFVILHSLFRSANSGSNSRCVLFIYFSLCDAHWRLEEVDESSLKEMFISSSVSPTSSASLFYISQDLHTHTRAQSTDRQSQSTSCSTISLVLTVLSPFLSPSRLIPFPYLASSHLCSAISSVSLTDILTLPPTNCFSLHTWHISPLI